MITDPIDPTERLSADDMATQREGQFLAAALASQQRASAVRQAKPGKCAACAAVCLPLAVYCDDECRAEHERQQTIRRRQGRA